MNPLNRYTVAEETRQRVLEAAAALGYSPSMSARALRGKRELVLAIIPDWPIGHSTSRFLSSLAEEMSARGLTFMVRYSSDDVAAHELLWRSMAPAAVLSFVEISAEKVDRARAEGISVTMAFFDRRHETANQIELPEDATGRVQVEHLVATGRRRLAIALPLDERLAAFVVPRTEGVRDGCADLGLVAPVEITVALTPEDGRRAVEDLISQGIDGVCCYNDELALAIVAGAAACGIVVPDELAVIGVDDDPVAAMYNPALSTVRLDVEHKAARIADAIVAGIKGDELTELLDDREGITVIRRRTT